MDKTGENSSAIDSHKSEMNDAQNTLGRLKSSWKQFDAAGSQLMVQLSSSLAGNQFENTFKETVALLGPVFACGQSELVLRRLKEMESLLGQMTSTENGAKSDDRKSASDKQVNKQM